MVPTRALKVLFLVGPTASGKSDWALQLAQKIPVEIINADSRQFYRETRVGTAKPSLAELDAVPHHLIDCASLTDPWNVNRFVMAARAVIDEIASRGRLPVVVGGTGLYLKSLLYGVDTIPAIDAALRARLQAELASEGLVKLYERLQNLDPEGARRLKSGDTQRILRALEVVEQTGKPIHTFWSSPNRSYYDSLRVGPNWPRDELYTRINARVEQMFVAGLQGEAKRLWEDFPQNQVLSSTIGYREWSELGFENEELVKAAIQQNTRHFAKRQLTWFRKESDIVWQDTGRDSTQTLLKLLHESGFGI